MYHALIKLFLLLLLAVTVEAKDGLSQKHLLSIKDNPLEIKFDLPIYADSVKKNTISLKSRDKKIEGITTLKDEHTLLFTPNSELREGEYKAKIKRVKLYDNKRESMYKKMLYKVCSYFYENVDYCPLCRYFCSVKTKKIKYTFKIDNKPKIKEISLDRTKIELNENNSTTLIVNAVYDDNTTVDVSSEVEWIVEDGSIVSMNKNQITGVKEGKTNLYVKYRNRVSNKIPIRVYKVINGYRLPLEPDEELNNATLLGIDSNNNGVRDDVERWIFLEMEIYNGYEKIEQVIAMQEAKANQMALKDPSNSNDKVYEAMNAATDCWVWYDYIKKLPSIGNIDKFSRSLKDKSFKTKERLKTYWQYDSTLAGRVFTLTKTLDTKTQCEVDIDGL